MAILTEGIRTSDYIISEDSIYRSRDEVTFTAPSGGAVAGTVLGKVTSSGKYVPHDASLANGAQNAIAILFEGVAEAGDIRRTVSARATEVNAPHLTFKDGITAPQKAAALASLETVGIVARMEA